MKTLARTMGACALAMCTMPAAAVTISGTYYEDQAVAANAVVCPVSNSCILTFPLSSAIAGKLLTITEIACSGNVSPRVPSAVAFITDNGANPRRFRALDVGSPAVGGQFSWAHSAMEYKVTGGPPRSIYVQLTADASTAWAVSCSIVGKISDQ